MSRAHDLPEVPSRRLMLKSAALAASAPVSLCIRDSPGAAPYVNPLVRQRADPHITRHTDGRYYFTATVPEYDRIILRRARTLNGLATAAESVIWRAHTNGPMGAHIWAPELHRVGGKWYIYFASAPAEDVWAIRIWVLENAHQDPFQGAWAERGQIRTAWETRNGGSRTSATATTACSAGAARCACRRTRAASRRRTAPEPRPSSGRSSPRART